MGDLVSGRQVKGGVMQRDCYAAADHMPTYDQSAGRRELS